MATPTRNFMAGEWQRYGYEHILRLDDATLAFARYVLENPVRAALVMRPEDYPFSGSLTYSVEEILKAASVRAGKTSG